LSDERAELLADLRERARMYAALTEVGVPRGTADRVPAFAAATAAAGAVSAPATAAAYAPGLGATPASASAPPPSPSAEALGLIREDVGDCRRCRLAETRQTIVFGQGNPSADLMFVGEAPGADEDEQGLAFVGRAGQLLTDIIEKGLKMPRAHVFIANVLMCRPPGNRNPEPDEILACQPFLERKIDEIRPRVLVGLGKFAGQWLLKTAEPISKIRGRVGDYKGIKVVPTYHPAFLLRNPSAKKDVWEDMKVVLSLLK
jgi:DNA polymerase